MSRYCNYHMHTRFSDGKGSPEEYAAFAHTNGFFSIGFAEHAPLPFPTGFALTSELMPDYIREIRLLSEEYQGKMDVFAGLEMDFIPGVSHNFATLKLQHGIDFLIGSVHLIKAHDHEALWFIDGPFRETWDQGLHELFHSDIRKAVGAYFNQVNLMLSEEEFDILGHFDKIKMHNKDRFFREEEAWYQNLVRDSLYLIAEKGVLLEINTRGLYKKRSESLFPDISILKIANEMGIPLVLSSDAHQAEEMAAFFPETLHLLLETGIRELWYLTPAGWSALAVDRFIR